MVLLPSKINKNIKKYKIKKSMQALEEEGLLASVYEEKEKVLLSYNKAKKNLNDTPLYLLLKLQNYLIKGNEAQCFNTYKRMLDFSASRPLAIKGLILVANKNSDIELFANILENAKNLKIPLNLFIFEAIDFCVKNGQWDLLKEHTRISQKISNKIKNAISFLNFNLAKKCLESGNQEESKKYLEEIFQENLLSVILNYIVA